MKLLDFPIIKLTYCLIIGILLGKFLNPSLIFACSISISLLVLSLTILLTVKNKFKSGIWFGLFTFLTTISIGLLVSNLHNEANYKNHYVQSYDFDSNPETKIIFCVRKVLKSSKYHDRYWVKIIKKDSQISFGKMQLNIVKDSNSFTLQVDDILQANTKIQSLNDPFNPYQFNYKNYLENQNIYAQIYIEANKITIINRESHSLIGYANRFRKNIINHLERYEFKPNELAVIKALLLGYRQDINKNLYQDYVNAGAIHILAISGLHVGIILMILDFLLGFLKRFRYGLLIKTALILFLLWSFAAIAGFSASVLRAVTMFSAVAIGMNLKRPYNIYNTLAISAFVLLLFNPLLLYQIGFQLSYLAVIGIVSIQPMLYRLIKSKSWLLDKIWQLTTVSIAAQIAIFPLTIFYFHQFPGLFLVSNVIIIPFLGLILSYGFIVIILAILKTPDFFLFDIYDAIIRWMNILFSWVAKKESFILTDIPTNIYLTIGLYLIIISCTQYFKQKSFFRLTLLLSSFLCFQILLFFNKWYVETNSEVVIFNKNKHSVIGFKKGNHLLISHNMDSFVLSNDKVISNYQIGAFIDTINEDSLRSVYKFKDKKFLIIDSLGIYSLKRFSPDYVLLRNSPKINMNRLIDSLKPKAIIADGSNYHSYSNSWKQTADKRKLPFYQTNKKGAFILKLK